MATVLQWLRPCLNVGLLMLKPGQSWANQVTLVFALGLCISYSLFQDVSHFLFTPHYCLSLVSAWISLLQIAMEWWNGLFVPSRSRHSMLSLQPSLYCDGWSASLALINTLKAGIFFPYLYSKSLTESLAYSRCSIKFCWINAYQYKCTLINCHLIQMTIGEVMNWMLLSSQMYTLKS